MTRRYPDPSPPQGELDLEPFKLATPAPERASCGVPQRFGQDQYRCNLCGRVWDVGDIAPDCHTHT